MILADNTLMIEQVTRHARHTIRKALVSKGFLALGDTGLEPVTLRV